MSNSQDHRQFAQSLYRLHSRRGNTPEAAQVLEQILAGKDWPQEDVHWAKREKAILLSQKPATQEREQAVSLLKEVPTQKTSLPDRREKVNAIANVLRSASVKARPALITEGIQLLRSVTEDREATDRDWFQLGQFYRLAHQRENYRNTLQELIHREPGNLYYRSAFVDELLVDQRAITSLRTATKLTAA